MRHLLLVLALLLLYTAPAAAQNCQPRPSAVQYMQDFTPAALPCYRVDYLFSPAHEAWYCGNNQVIDFPFFDQRGITTGRVWWLDYWSMFNWTLSPEWTLRCLCNVESCSPGPWR